MWLREVTFRPGLVPSLVTIVMFCVLLGLGFWQLDRARQKESLQHAFLARTSLPPVPLSSLDIEDPGTRYYKVSAQGRYDVEHQILLDNQVQAGRPGYHVYTPLQLTGESVGILVNRGWVALGESRQSVPDLTIVVRDVNIAGSLGQPANPGIRLQAESNAAVSWPQVVGYVDYRELAEDLGYPLAPTVMLLSPESGEGFLREWRPHVPGMGPQRHRGYALQWFSLAATLVVIYVVVNMRRRERSGE